ncbi:MAG TPA: hypothetical protein V6C89_18675 [Drouetiella sp.]
MAFIVGFTLVGGAWAWIVYADQTDIHQQSYHPDQAPGNALISLFELGIPAGLLAAGVTAGVSSLFKKEHSP